MIRHSKKAWLASISAAVVLTTFSIPGHGAPRIQTGPDAEVTYDGLHRVDRSAMEMAWVKPDLNLNGYSKVILQAAPISYREVDEPRSRNSAHEFPISDSQRQRLQETVREAFLAQLSDLDRYEITDQTGRDTLILRGAIIDVVSQVPPPRVGRSEVYLASVGEATLVVELLDSVSGEVLARAADREAAGRAGMPFKASSVTAWAEARQVANSWARLLRRRLDEFTTTE